MEITLLFSLLAISTAYPVTEPATTTDITTTSTDEQIIEDYKKEVENAAYKIQFKNVLTEYVVNEEKDLTITERDKVQDIIEDLLENLVRDISIIVNNEGNSEDAVGRIGDTTFDEIHKCVILGIPDINEHNALRLAHRLERNLLRARQKLDRVIADSRLARLQNS